MKTKLMLLLLTIAACGISLIMLRDWATLSPLKREESVNMLSQAVIDEQQAIYLIADSKKTLQKIDADGKLVYSVSSKLDSSSTNTFLFNDVTTDSQGNAYVLITVLDQYGLKVSGEHILKISRNGRQKTMLYTALAAEDDNLMRVGRIQSLQVVGSELHFFSRSRQSASLQSISTSNQLQQFPTHLASFELPSDRYLKEVTGITPTIMTTKQGYLYLVQEDQLQQLFPNNDEPTLHFPIEVEIEIGGNQHIYYIDAHEAAIKRLIPQDNGSTIENVVTLQQLSQAREDIDWQSLNHVSLQGEQIVVTALGAVAVLNPAGELQTVVAGYTYSMNQLAMRVLFWLIVVGLALLTAYTVRYIYVVMLQRKLYLLLKQLLLVIPLLAASMTWLSYTVYHSVSEENKKDTFNQLKILAANGKYLIDGDMLQQINSPRDYRGSAYATIKEQLNEVFPRSRSDHDGLYNTIYRYMNGQIYVVMDDDDSVTMFQPIEPTESDKLVIERGTVELGELSDETGNWLFALGPIYNSSGELVGIYETGKDMVAITSSNIALLHDIIKIVLWISLVLGIVITIMTIYFLSSIRKLRRSVNQIAGGEWDIEVEIRTRDEIEELGERFNMMATAIKNYVLEVTRLSSAYFRFVPQQFLKVLGKSNMSDVELGEQQTKHMTILVCNMRRFHELSATMSTKDNFAFINSLLKQLGPVIREHGGFISRYLGPGMLTMFPNHTNYAIRAAFHLRLSLNSYNAQRAQQGLPPIELGIAIDAGDVMLGIIGEEQRLEGSVISNQVQLTLDLERLSEQLGVSVLLTAQARNALELARAEHCRHLGWIQLPASKEPVQLYDWYEADEPHIRQLKIETKKVFEKAIDDYRSGRFYDAREGFVYVVKRNRYDLAAKLYFFASDQFYQEGTQPDWNTALRIS